jgi:hypothetical protein
MITFIPNYHFTHIIQLFEAVVTTPWITKRKIKIVSFALNDMVGIPLFFLAYFLFNVDMVKK